MKLGFIGTGVITEAIINGLMKGGFAYETIFISERSAEISSRLATTYERVAVCADNQHIVDQADVVVLAIRPQIAEEVIRPLRFHPDQQVISLVAATLQETLDEWIGLTLPLCRAIPLPFVAEGIGVTALFPALPVAETLFTSMGSVVNAATLAEFDNYVVASATMGTHFQFLDTIGTWLHQQGASEANARTYLGALYAGLSHTTMKRADETFAQLQEGHCTPGGLNEQMARVFVEQGGNQALIDAMNSIKKRIS